MVSAVAAEHAGEMDEHAANPARPGTAIGGFFATVVAAVVLGMSAGYLIEVSVVAAIGGVVLKTALPRESPWRSFATGVIAAGVVGLLFIVAGLVMIGLTAG
ncbi:hypothetical protein [Actinokineospora sp. HUAS TT18]|uniref:hypothetical protein n=1 Tax=Actinokineospora sp. HUAS TT18 TaxID=3447451 RepID=UPI003F523242